MPMRIGISPTCVVVKRTNPCVVASRDDILEAYRLAVKADPVSAFGGIALAKEIREFRSPTDGETRMFYEIVVAPKYTKKKGSRVAAETESSTEKKRATAAAPFQRRRSCCFFHWLAIIPSKLYLLY
ncbi:hypothetical protein DVH24_004914 [Malus domestica]|uniref:Uncharacterized protein n=1 Tax=Malus domestica TaxID=3750 RepID=A0A498ICQ5_MALDO|nr:hypothetical protein DVH24_004914 [Malus domestica]